MADKTRLLALAGPVEDLRVPQVQEALNGARKKEREALAQDLRFVFSALQMRGQKGAEDQTAQEVRSGFGRMDERAWTSSRTRAGSTGRSTWAASLSQVPTMTPSASA